MLGERNGESDGDGVGDGVLGDDVVPPRKKLSTDREMIVGEALIPSESRDGVCGIPSGGAEARLASQANMFNPVTVGDPYATDSANILIC